MPAKLNLENKRFGRLTVLSYAGNGFWSVQCDCGKNKKMRTATLKVAQSCGCIRAEKSKEQGEQKRNYKVCPVCGKSFYCLPSSKTVTCSAECKSKRRSALLAGHQVQEETRNAISEKASKRGTPKSFKAMIKANANSPKCQRGEMQSAAKKWTIKNTDTQETFSFTNLEDWIRNNLNRFDRLHPNDKEKDVSRISHGFYTIKKNLRNGNSCITYKGWQIINYDDRKNYERNYQ